MPSDPSSASPFELSAATPINPDLLAAQDRFIAAWGQMGSTWGISRTMAEVHALLYITGRPLCTDDAMDRLQISRGNASMSLRALVEWGIVTRAHKRGDRKEYFQAEQDVWSILKAVVRERMKREIHPVMASLFEIRDMTVGEPASSPVTAGAPDGADPAADHRRRMDAMIGLLETFDTLGGRFIDASPDDIRATTEVLSRSATLT